MTTQPEQILVNNLVKQLAGLEHAYVHIKNEEGIPTNLKRQLITYKSDLPVKTNPATTNYT